MSTALDPSPQTLSDCVRSGSALHVPFPLHDPNDAPGPSWIGERIVKLVDLKAYHQFGTMMAGSYIYIYLNLANAHATCTP